MGNGELMSEIDQSSGHPLLDQEAMDLIKTVSPLMLPQLLERPKPILVPILYRPMFREMSDRTALMMNRDNSTQVAMSPIRTRPARSVSEEVNRLLGQPTVMVEMPRPTAPDGPQLISKRMPIPAFRVSGVTHDNGYLERVQRLISAQWVVPQLTAMDDQIQVDVKFRVEKTGKVSRLVIERTSGNEYYDMAAMRAVRAAILPAFPGDMSQSYFDAHFHFAVGE